MPPKGSNDTVTADYVIDLWGAGGDCRKKLGTVKDVLSDFNAAHKQDLQAAPASGTVVP